MESLVLCDHIHMTNIQALLRTNLIKIIANGKIYISEESKVLIFSRFLLFFFSEEKTYQKPMSFRKAFRNSLVLQRKIQSDMTRATQVSITSTKVKNKSLIIAYQRILGTYDQVSMPV